MNDFNTTKETQLKSYKGFEIWKIEEFTYFGTKVSTEYEVSDADDAIDFFKTLSEAKKYIDTVLV